MSGKRSKAPFSLTPPQRIMEMREFEELNSRLDTIKLHSSRESVQTVIDLVHTIYRMGGRPEKEAAVRAIYARAMQYHENIPVYVDICIAQNDEFRNILEVVHDDDFRTIITLIECSTEEFVQQWTDKKIGIVIFIGFLYQAGFISHYAAHLCACKLMIKEFTTDLLAMGTDARIFLENVRILRRYRDIIVGRKSRGPQMSDQDEANHEDLMFMIEQYLDKYDPNVNYHLPSRSGSYEEDEEDSYSMLTNESNESRRSSDTLGSMEWVDLGPSTSQTCMPVQEDEEFSASSHIRNAKPSYQQLEQENYDLRMRNERLEDQLEVLDREFQRLKMKAKNKCRKVTQL